MSVTAYIALGSNLGNREDFLDRALQMLREQPGIRVNRVSSIHVTEPVGGPPGQENYLNAAAELQTDLNPQALLKVLLDVEQKLGRVRKERHGPRIIDLDLLLYSNVVRDEPGLTVPHPRMHQRLFVLEPLAELAPDLVHPVFGRPIWALLDNVRLEEEQHRRPVDKQGVSGEESPAPPVVESGSEATMADSGRELAGLRALVTGSTSGIGQAIALELAVAGADVIVHGRRLDAAAGVAQQLQKSRVLSRFMLADLSAPDECRRLVQTAWDEWGGIDIWINNAGADTLTGEAADWPFERKLAELLAVDVTATMLLAREIGQRMKTNGGGVIVNMGWDQAETGMEGDSGQLFAAAKGAVMAFTRSLAVTLAPQVRVNCLAPGWIRTAWGTQASERWQERARREAPLARWGTPRDVASAARWLVSPAAAFITGQVIRVNGGAVR